MKVKHKLLFIGLAIIIIVSLSIYSYSEYQSRLIDKTNNQVFVLSKISILSYQININIDNFQINDIYNEEFYEKEISANLDSYKLSLKVLESLADSYFNEELNINLNHHEADFNRIISRLEASINKLVDAYLLLGFNDYGLEGRFSIYRDEMEENFSSTDEHEFELFIEYISRQEMKFVHRKLEKYMEKIEDSIDEILPFIVEQETFIETSDNYMQSMSDYRNQFVMIGLTPEEGLRGDLQSSLLELDSFLNKLSQETVDVVNEASRNKSVFGLFFIIISILVSSFVFILLSRHVSNPLFLLSESAIKISDGDLSLSIQRGITERKDEIGHLGKAFGLTVNNLRNTVEQIKIASEKNRTVGEILRKNADQTSQSAKSVDTSLNNFMNLFESLDQNISRSRSSTERIYKQALLLGDNITGQASAIEEAGSTINQMVSHLKSISDITDVNDKISRNLVNITAEGYEKVKDTNSVIQKISENTDQMRGLTDLINGIAGQTNLLAMNAAIEAAHAGDAGKGFGVVSEEIRKLSEETSEAVKGISQYLNSVIEQIDQALVSSENSGASFERVNKSVEETSLSYTEISSMVKEISSGSQEILKVVSQINKITGEVNTDAVEISEVIKSLDQDMDNIVSLSTKGTVEINETLDSIRIIDSYTNKVAELSDSNEKIIEQLRELVSGFKL